MNSVSPLGGSFGGVNVNSAKTGRPSGPAQVEKELTKFLGSKGISAEDQASIKADIQESIRSSLSSDGRPDPSKLKSTINGVFEKHGLDGKEFTSKLPTPPSGPSGGLTVKGSTESEQIQSLLDFLTERAEDSKASEKEAAESATNQPATEGLVASPQPAKPYSGRSEGSLDVEA